VEPSQASRTWGRTQTGTLAAGSGVGFVSADTLAGLLQQRAQGSLNLYVFDVRQVPEYEAGHIAGSVALPGALAVQRTDEFVAIRNALIVFVDDDETRALMTAYWFHRMGMVRASVLLGGVASFGGELEKERRREPPLGLDEARAGAHPMGPDELIAWRKAGRPLTVIDVGTSVSFNRQHLPGAVWVPRGWLEMRIDGVAPDREAALLVSCPDGIQSAFAAETLTQFGYRDVRVLTGGTRKCDAGGLVTDEASAPSEDDIVRQPYEKGLADMKQYLEWEIALSHQPVREMP
jgi:rhodanese-related sulfurtransferase